ncbi:patatin-like phospholipase family protein [Pseudooceanicola sp. LIPI14-2-Ac024]|uniref:patatin-like phospholipase family protein n=1 Tax=Pseudooceanicola sp. LIPI14-2-Ac024 TaxID=3344875 RepID=UPI0035CFCC34
MLKVNLALQGGGAHGAFTWGVLDRLLDDEEIEVAGISGTSAGALNGAAFKAGMVAGGREGARAALDTLWGRMGAVNDMRLPAWMIGATYLPGDYTKMMEMSFPYTFAETMSRLTSPYAYGPFWTNPLRPVVDEFDFDKVCGEPGPDLFVCATNVRTGKIHIFSGDQITTDAILASACLPSIFRAVEIENPVTGEMEAYWDGGYTGNPALYPLFSPGLPDDIIVVNLNPMQRDEVPKSPQAIQNRINEISFNTSLLRELRLIEFAQRLVIERDIPEGTIKDLKIHMISDNDLMNELSVATKLVPNPFLLHRLKTAGRAAADRFLDQHKAAIGKESSVSLPDMFA